MESVHHGIVNTCIVTDCVPIRHNCRISMQHNSKINYYPFSLPHHLRPPPNVMMTHEEVKPAAVELRARLAKFEYSPPQAARIVKRERSPSLKPSVKRARMSFDLELSIPKETVKFNSQNRSRASADAEGSDRKPKVITPPDSNSRKRATSKPTESPHSDDELERNEFGSDEHDVDDHAPLEFEILDQLVDGAVIEEARRKVETSQNSKGKEKAVAPKLKGLDDHLQSGLDLVFCGINPGLTSSRLAQHYAHKSNHFWKCLHQGGFTAERLEPSESENLPALINVGLTNLCNSVTRRGADVPAAEMRGCVGPLIEKLIKNRPKVCCFIGMGMRDDVLGVLGSLPSLQGDAPRFIPPPLVVFGLQAYCISFAGENGGPREHCWLHCVPSTSGLVVKYQVRIRFYLRSKNQQTYLSLAR